MTKPTSFPVLRAIGARTIDSLWRLGFATRFLLATLRHTPEAFRRFGLTVREIYFTGVLSLTRGAVTFRGKPVGGLSSRQIAERGMSRTFQHVKMIPEMTVLENVALGGYLRTTSGPLRAMLRLDRAEERALFAEAEAQLQRIGMAGQMNELAGNLALGPQRLMEIARALCTDPALLLLDEPAAGLRHKEKQALAAVLRQLKAEGKIGRAHV